MRGYRKHRAACEELRKNYLSVGTGCLGLWWSENSSNRPHNPRSGASSTAVPSPGFVVYNASDHAQSKCF